MMETYWLTMQFLLIRFTTLINKWRLVRSTNIMFVLFQQKEHVLLFPLKL